MQAAYKRKPKGKKVRMSIGNNEPHMAYFRYIRRISHLSHHAIFYIQYSQHQHQHAISECVTNVPFDDPDVSIWREIISYYAEEQDNKSILSAPLKLRLKGIILISNIN